MNWAENLAAILTTVERNDAVKRCIASLREQLPGISIYVADQSDESPEKRDFYNTFGVQAYFIGPDRGLSYSRNFLIRQVKEPYILLIDDDFIFEPDNGIKDALEIIQHDHEIGVLGGCVEDVQVGADGSIESRRRRNFEHVMVTHEDFGMLILIPLQMVKTPVRKFRQWSYTLCDVVLNFAILRKDLFDNPDIHWNDDIKIFGEHEDFYLRFRKQEKYKVAYFSEMKVAHQRILNPKYRELRYRTNGLEVLAKEWGLSQVLEVGRGLTALDPVQPIVEHRVIKPNASVKTPPPTPAKRWLKKIKSKIRTAVRQINP